MTVLLAVFVVTCLALEAGTGFGALLLALSVGTLLFPAPQLLALLLPLNALLAAAWAIGLRGHLRAGLLLKVVTPLLAGGTLTGLWLQPWLQTPWLGLFFALVLVVLSGRALYLGGRGEAYRQPRWASRLQLAGAGFSHGLFGSGGPLLVFALAGTDSNRAQLRAAMACVWLCLSLLVMAWPAVRLQLPATRVSSLMLLPPALLAALWAQRAFGRLPEPRYRPLVYGLLLATGLVLLGRALYALI